MNTFKYIVNFFIFILLFNACSTKEVYEPKKLSDDWKKYKDEDHAIVGLSSNIALLDDRTVLLADGHKNIQIDQDKRVISKSDDWILSASIDGNLTIQSIKDSNITKHFNLKKTIAGASIDHNKLAVLFYDNEIALYNLDTKKMLFEDQGGRSVAVNMKVVNPYFLNDLVLFPTLDGKIVIVSIKHKKRLRTVLVSSEDNFNNIIYFNFIDDKIISATGYKILSLSQQKIRKKYEIRDVVCDGDEIYISTKQGEIISLSKNLDVIKKIKFPFAHFLGMINNNDKLYLLEKEGYMIVVNKKDFTYNVHEVDFDDGFVFVGKTGFM